MRTLKRVEIKAQSNSPYTCLRITSYNVCYTKLLRIKVLTQSEPNILFQNWGKNLDGASLVTGILNINGRDVALYGHDFTVRAGSIDATNGTKLAKLFNMAGEKGIPVIGMNDSAGAFVPAGVGGLDGYAEAFTALRKISGVVPTIMCIV